MNIERRTAVVAGGTGNIGIGIVKQLISRGYQVVVPYRNAGKLEALRIYLGSESSKLLIPIKADLSSFDSAMFFQLQLKEHVKWIDIGVASLGGWWKGRRLSEVNGADYQKVMKENVNTHFFFSRSISPMFRKQGYGTYVAINGPVGLYERKGTELLSIAGWMQFKLVEFLNTELREYGAKAYELFVAEVLTRQPGRFPSEESITPEEIGAYIINLHTGNVEHPENMTQNFFKVNLPWFKV